MTGTRLRRTVVPVYRFKNRDSIPDSECIRMTESHRLPGNPARQTLYAWTNVGVRLRWMPGNVRLLLPTFIRHGRKVTTLQAHAWWEEQQQEPQ